MVAAIVVVLFVRMLRKCSRAGRVQPSSSAKVTPLAPQGEALGSGSAAYHNTDLASIVEQSQATCQGMGRAKTDEIAEKALAGDDTTTQEKARFSIDFFSVPLRQLTGNSMPSRGTTEEERTQA
eukprot:CAMPEP_0179026842 /NCGR_PEP_ID=MMETSP0796-20121207/8728_1 /TAXON_ID=73915 /ORGANISM="Pyrodinium bahamense, Strain pbaha01" /LENGTH=123 /DNA_ID=CAMNT_0020722945 /DNA_START=146 /DNA_END=517 /DNA_ORIENTATION=-